MDVGLDEWTVKRIIARLVSFAVLAERAAGRALPVRWFVLALLRHALCVTLDHLAETTGVDWTAHIDGDPEQGIGPADAVLLAGRFRTLAALLAALLPQEHGFGRPDGRATGRDPTRPAFTPSALAGLAASGGWPHRAPDTS